MKVKINTKMPAKRNLEAIALQNFRSTTFHHKTAPRGGATNGFGDLLDEVAEDQEIQAELALLDDGAE